MTARGWLFLALVGILMTIGAGLAGAIWGPKLFAARQAVETQTDAAVSANLAASGAEATTAEVQDHHVLVDVVTDQTHALALEAQKDPTNDAPLPDPARDRLRRHDQLLCDARPRLCPDRQGDGASRAAAPG